MKHTTLLFLFFILNMQAFSQLNKYKDIIDQLFIIDNDDQKYRVEIQDIETKYGLHSRQVDSLWTLLNKTDSINLLKVKAILDKYGWLGINDIGSQCNTTLFMVIQHADLKTQEHYLPLMREAVKNKKARAGELALLEDRVALRNSKEQIYGSQIGQDEKTLQYYVLPLLDPDNVDKRRAEVGLRPISEYLQHWDLKWDVEQYKKDLVDIKAKLKTMQTK
jgi:hypothetical protein